MREATSDNSPTSRRVEEPSLDRDMAWVGVVGMEVETGMERMNELSRRNVTDDDGDDDVGHHSYYCLACLSW